MRRNSNRGLILDSAFKVIEREGVRAMTFESVAVESGLTKGGLLYHFPSRDALLQALHVDMASRWALQLSDLLGKDVSESTAAERMLAYVRSTSENSTRAELLLLLETADDSEFSTPWKAVQSEWAQPDSHSASPEEVANLLTARYAADGLWLNDALSAAPMSSTDRERITERIARLIQP